MMFQCGALIPPKSRLKFEVCTVFRDEVKIPDTMEAAYFGAKMMNDPCFIKLLLTASIPTDVGLKLVNANCFNYRVCYTRFCPYRSSNAKTTPSAVQLKNRSSSLINCMTDMNVKGVNIGIFDIMNIDQKYKPIVIEFLIGFKDCTVKNWVLPGSAGAMIGAVFRARETLL